MSDYLVKVLVYDGMVCVYVVVIIEIIKEV